MSSATHVRICIGIIVVALALIVLGPRSGAWETDTTTTTTTTTTVATSTSTTVDVVKHPPVTDAVPAPQLTEIHAAAPVVVAPSFTG